jgi:hypothetical protein
MLRYVNLYWRTTFSKELPRFDEKKIKGVKASFGGRGLEMLKNSRVVFCDFPRERLSSLSRVCNSLLLLRGFRLQEPKRPRPALRQFCLTFSFFQRQNPMAKFEDPFPKRPTPEKIQRTARHNVPVELALGSRSGLVLKS